MGLRRTRALMKYICTERNDDVEAVRMHREAVSAIEESAEHGARRCGIDLNSQ